MAIWPVRWWAAVPRAASPSEAPIWRELLSRPEAVPVSWGATPAVAMETTGPRQSPKPTLATIEGPRTSVMKAPSGLIRPNQANPVAVRSPPMTSRVRGASR